MVHSSEWVHASPGLSVGNHAHALQFTPAKKLWYKQYCRYHIPVASVVGASCMGGSYRKQAARRRTATMLAPLSHCGPVKYEAGLHNKKIKRLLVFLCVRRDVCRDHLNEPDNT